MAHRPSISGESLAQDGADSAVGGFFGFLRSLLPFGLGYNSIINRPLSKLEAQAQQAAREAAGSATKDPEIAKVVKEGESWWASLEQAISDFFTNLFSPETIPARDRMLARIGLSPSGSPTGTNPFTALDKSLGVPVAAAIQQVCEDHARDVADSLDPKGAAPAAKKLHEEIYDAVYASLAKKYGERDDNKKSLESLAEATANSISGLQSNGTGMLAMFQQVTHSPSHTVNALVLDTEALRIVSSQLAALNNGNETAAKAAAAKAAEGKKPLAVADASAPGAPTAPAKSKAATAPGMGS